MKDPPVGSFTTENLLAAYETADALGQPLSRHCYAICLQTHPSEDAAAELRHGQN